MRSKDPLIFAAVSVAASVFAFVIALPRQWSRGFLIVDEFWQGHLAQSVYRGDGYVSNVMYPIQAMEVQGFPVPEALKQSGYSVLGAAIWLLTGEGHRPLVFLSIVFCGLFAGFIYLLARRLDWSPAWSAAIAGAVVLEPNVARFGTAAAPESLLFALFTGTVLLALDRRPVALAGAGVLHALAMVVKGHALIYIPLIAIFLALRDRKLQWRPPAIYLASLLVVLVILSVALPAGSVQLVQSGGSYAMAFLAGMEGFPMDELGYKHVERIDAWGYLFDHPVEFIDKVLRMISRTKGIIEVLGGPAMGGVLLPLLCLAIALFLAEGYAPGTVFSPRSREDGGAGADHFDVYLLFVALIAATFGFFWLIYVISRWFVQVLPLMVLLIAAVASRFEPSLRALRPEARKVVALAAVGWFVLYPAVYTVWVCYRNPWQFIGSQMAVRFVDYEQMGRNLEELVPQDGVVVSEMAHEITWFTGRPTIMAPPTDEDLRVLASRFDVAAVYQHPLFPREWSLLEEDFELVDVANGRLWVRRDLLR